MMQCVSEKCMCLHEKITGRKALRTRRVDVPCNNCVVSILRIQDTLDTFSPSLHLATSHLSDCTLETMKSDT